MSKKTNHKDTNYVKGIKNQKIKNNNLKHIRHFYLIFSA